MAQAEMPEVTSNSDGARKEAIEDSDYILEEETSLTMKKPNPVGRFLGRLGIAPNFEGVGQMVMEEVIGPMLLDGLRDAIYAATDYILYSGESNRSRGSRKGYTNYGKKSQRGKSGKISRKPPNSASYYFTHKTRQDAERVLEKMRDVIESRDFVTVLDMYAIAKRQTTNYTYDDWGWYDLKSAMPRRADNGEYYLALPKPVPIEDD